MKNIQEIRRQNFTALLSAYERDVEFAEAIDRSPSYIYQIKTGRRNIGHNVSRDIEKTMDLPEGWMDVEHVPNYGDSVERAIKLLKTLDDDKVNQVIGFITLLKQQS